MDTSDPTRGKNPARKSVLPVDVDDAESVLAQFAQLGVDDTALAARPQREGTQSFDKSWKDLMQGIAAKSTDLKTGAV